MHAPETEVILRHDGTELARVSLPPGAYVIGRSSDVEISAKTPLLSRRHARLTLEDGQCLIEDLGSSNGTFLDDVPVTAAVSFAPGQALRLGPIVLEVTPAPALEEPVLTFFSGTNTVQNVHPVERLGGQRYSRGQEIARGGMGAILQAHEEPTLRKVAMKVMLDSSAEEHVRRFIEEAQVTAQLDHPNIVPVYELGIDEHGHPFYTMKLVRGITLKKVLKLLTDGVEATVKKYPLSALLTIFQKACDAVAFAHSKGVIHRDLKPENIMLGDFGSVLVLDWGLAKIVGHDAQPASQLARSIVQGERLALGDSGATLAGSIMGTPQYMSPEQARGEVETLDFRSDVFSLGAILFHLLHLRPIAAAKTGREVIEKVARGEIDWTPPKKPIPAGLLAVCRKALAVDRDARYRTVQALQRDLAAYQAGFATAAEKAGLGKQLTLLVKRHKVVFSSIGVALIVIAVIAAVSFQQITAERNVALGERNRAERALADLKKTAPTMLALADSEADAMRFESALEKLDAAIALAPEFQAPYWRRAWVLIGLERWADAAAAVRMARQRDPAYAKAGDILPTLEVLTTATPGAGLNRADADALIRHLEAVGANGELNALSGKLRLGAEAKRKLVEARLLEWLGPGNANRTGIDASGRVCAFIDNVGINTLERLRGLPIEVLAAVGNKVSSLEPLKGMQLSTLVIYANPVSDLSPLRGMPLRVLKISDTKVADLSPLAGMPLQTLFLANTKVTDLTPLRGAPLEDVDFQSIAAVDYSPLRGAPIRKAAFTKNIGDLSVLADSPIENLSAYGTPISDLSPLRGKPLAFLRIEGTPVKDLSPLRGAPIVELIMPNTSVSDLKPLLDLPKLEKLRIDRFQTGLEPLRRHPTLRFVGIDGQAYQPVDEFWAAFDARQATKAK